MSFERPWVLLFLIAAPMLLLLLRRLQRLHSRPATSFLLFARAAQRLAEAPRERTFDWQELLQLLPMLVVILALAAPSIRTDDARSLVALVDTSLSMGTALDGRSRTERGLARVAAFGEAFRQLPVSAADLGLRAHELVQAGERVVVVSDKEITGLPAEAGVVLVGDKQANAGITTAGLDDDGNLLVRGTACGETGRRTLRITTIPGGSIVTTQEIQAWPFRLVEKQVHLRDGAALQIALEPADANPADDTVRLLPSSDRLVVRLPLEGHNDLERAFLADPLLDVRRGVGDADLFVGIPNLRLEAQLKIAPHADFMYFQFGPVRRVRGRMEVHGALGDFPIGEEFADDPVHTLASAPTNTEVLVAVGEIPLLVRSGSAFVLLVDPEQSTWRSRRSFPLICSEIAHMVKPAGDRLVRHMLDEQEVTGPFVERDRVSPPASPADAPEKDLSLVAWAAALALLLLLFFERGSLRLKRR